jgi:Zn-dependent protease
MTIGRVLDLEIRVHPSWALILVLVVISVVPWLTGAGPAQLSTPAALVVSGALAAALFASVVAHELAHALVARRRGERITELTLIVLGGTSAATTATGSRAPLTEGLVAVAGPLLSIALGSLLLGLAWLMPGDGGEWQRALDWTLLLLGLANLLLAALHLIPSFPMDGGRLVRAVAWGLTGDLVRATRVASVVGRGFAYLLVFAGFLIAIGGTSTQILAGLWLVLIGWSLNRAARSSYNQVRLEQLVEGMRVSDALQRDVAVVGPGLTLDTLVEQHKLNRNVGMYPVTVDGDLVGAVDLGQVSRVPRRKWPTTRVIDVMRRADRLITFTEPEPLMAAVARFEQTGADAFPVVDPDDPRRLLGLVTRDDVIRLMRSRAARRSEATTR